MIDRGVFLKKEVGGRRKKLVDAILSQGDKRTENGHNESVHTKT